MAKTKIGYVDGFVLAVQKSKLRAYRQMAQLGRTVWMKHGALDYQECVIDDPKPPMVTFTFPRMVACKKSEVVIFAYITYKSRAHRDQVNARVGRDPLMNDPKYKNLPMPFDMRRLAFGGFKVLVGA